MASRIIPRTALAASRRRALAGPSTARRNASAAAGHDPTKAEPLFSPALAGASVVVFGGLGFYLLSGDAKKSEHDSHGFSSSNRKDLDWEYKKLAGEGLPNSGDHADSEDQGKDSGVVAATSDSGSDADEGEKDSVKASILSDAPQQAKQGEAEGTSPPTGQKSSVQQALNNDAPKTAKKAEEDIAQKKK